MLTTFPILLLRSCSMRSGLHSHPKPASRHWQERRNRHRGDRGSCDSRARVRCWRAGLGWPLYDAMFLAAVLSIGSTATHSGVVSGSFEFGEILMTIGRIGLFIGGTIFPPASLSCAYYSRSSPSWSATR